MRTRLIILQSVISIINKIPQPNTCISINLYLVSIALKHFLDMYKRHNAKKEKCDPFNHHVQVSKIHKTENESFPNILFILLFIPLYLLYTNVASFGQKHEYLGRWKMYIIPSAYKRVSHILQLPGLHLQSIYINLNSHNKTHCNE